VEKSGSEKAVSFSSIHTNQLRRLTASEICTVIRKPERGCPYYNGANSSTWKRKTRLVFSNHWELPSTQDLLCRKSIPPSRSLTNKAILTIKFFNLEAKSAVSFCHVPTPIGWELASTQDLLRRKSVPPSGSLINEAILTITEQILSTWKRKTWLVFSNHWELSSAQDLLRRNLYRHHEA
jgi:hypothetical protein